MSMHEPETSGHEPGLDLHEWETQWQQYHDLAEEDPAQALPEIADFVEAILRRRGFRPELKPEAAGQSADVIGAFRFAREVSDRIERGDDDVGPGDVGAAHEALREVYESLTGHRPG
jgi:hypothetical protein